MHGFVTKAMKTIFLLAIVIGLTVIAAPCCPAQEIKTVEACRSYREAWYTTEADDLEHLSIRVLIHRADQMEVCAREIDSKPLTTGMTHEEALRVEIFHMGYPALALAYKECALNRALRFIDNKGLTKEFISADDHGKIVRVTPR